MKKRCKLTKSIFREKQNRALKFLRIDPNIVIAKPDKSNDVIVLNHNAYVDKIHKILDDRTKFLPCNQDTNLSNFTKSQMPFYYLNSKTALYNESTQEYILLPQPLFFYTVYQNYTSLEFARGQFFPLVGPLITNVPGGYRNLS